jgi:hypothetical protein
VDSLREALTASRKTADAAATAAKRESEARAAVGLYTLNAVAP